MRTLNLLALGALLAVVPACSSGATSATTVAAPDSSAGQQTTITLPGTTIVVPVPLPTDAPSTSGVASAPDSAPSTPWQIDESSCPDPAAVTAPIAGTLTIAMAAPLTGGVAAAQWKPVIDGFRTAIDNANLSRALGNVRLDLKIVDDRLDPDRTEDALQGAIDAGAQVVAGIVGTDSNLAARFTLNEQCIPQLLGLSPSPVLGDVADYPWTMGFLPPVPDEVAALGTLVHGTLPGGGTLGVYAANGSLGDDYVAAAASLAADTGLTVVATERIAAGGGTPETAAIESLVAARPDVVLAAPDGLDCTLFLRGLAAQRSAAPDWKPVVLLASGCALPPVLRLAGPTADGVYSTSALADPAAGADPDVTGMADYVTWMQSAGLGAATAAAVPGWSAANALVAILQQAQRSGELSQASIIEAARSIDAPVALGRPGVVLRTDGTSDPFPLQSTQVIRWNAAAGTFDAVGPVVTTRES